MTNTTCCCVYPGEPFGHAAFKSNIWHTGSQKKVFKGYLFPSFEPSGYKKVCVKTALKGAWTEQFCSAEVTKCQAVQKLANEFNLRKLASTKIRTLVPQMAVMDEVASGCTLSENDWVLIEERLNGDFSKLNDSVVADSFTHFTFHATGGQLVACALKGGNYKNNITLSDPTVHSLDRRFGDLDKGFEGIKAVFEKHTCNHECCRWLKPDADIIDSETRKYFTQGQFERCTPTAPALEHYPVVIESHSNDPNSAHLQTASNKPGHGNNARTSVSSPLFPPPYREHPPTYAESELYYRQRGC